MVFSLSAIKSAVFSARSSTAAAAQRRFRHRTRRRTPEAPALQPMLAALVAEGGTAAILECSSHALVLERLAGCSFDVAIFLNLSRDHLDFHRDMDDYFEAKSRLFSMLKPEGKAIVNLGDAYGRRLASKLDAGRTVGFFLESEFAPEQTLPAVPRGVAALAGGLFATVIGRAMLGLKGTRLDVEPIAPFTFEEKTSDVTAPLRRERTDESGARFAIDSPLLGRSNAENLQIG